MIAALGLHFVKGGLVPKATFESLRLAFEVRNVADYDAQEFAAKDAQTLLERAELFVSEIESLVRL